MTADPTAPATAAVLPVTDATFAAEVTRRPGAVLVEFTAEWCGPCRMMAPVLVQIAAERANTLAVRTLDVDTNPATSRAHGVMGMPTMILFRDGRPVLSVTGARPRQRLLDELDRALAG
jgi:thioredoxin 1